MYVTGMQKASEAVIARFEEFFSQPQQALRLSTLAQRYPQEISFDLDVAELARFDPDLADELVEHPDSYIASAQAAIAKSGQTTSSGVDFRPRVRPFNLPDTSRPMVLDLGAAHLDKLISVEGVVSSLSEIKPRLKRAFWRCIHCDTTAFTDTDKTLPIAPPNVCQCGRRDFTLVEASSVFVNMQRAQMQDPVEKMRGNMPAVHAELWMEEDLTNRIAPGDKVIITGMLRLRPIVQGKSKSSVYSKFIDVVHIHEIELDFEELVVSPEEEAQIMALKQDPKLFEKVVASVAPSIYGHNELKAAIALQLFGGTPGKILPDGGHIRNDIHILLCGDPGIGKSTILEYVRRIAPKCVVVSGGSSTGVGITAAAERDEVTEGWVLKAGAMVLANGGMVAIDEVDKMREDDRGAMHQAMEQQRISVAKAGIVTEFQSRTSVLAAANPKLGRFDMNTPIAAQFNLSPPLLSRFDLIFAIRDVLDESKDRKMAAHILEGHRIASQKLRASSPGDAVEILPPVSSELLRKYIAFARRHVAPVITQEASEKIQSYYVELRKIGKEQNTFPVTARQIEGIIRLAEANAKLRMSAYVELPDAERAIALADFVLHEIFIDRETGKLDSDVVTIGQPKSKVDKIRSVLGLIASMEKQMDLVSIDDLVKESAAYGLDEQYARRLIDDLKRQGDLYEPRPGFVKSARGIE